MSKNLFRKDGVTYWFASRHTQEDGTNAPYGVSNTDKKAINSHLIETLSFYRDSFVEVNNQKIPFLNLAVSANITPERYQAELSNRIHTMKLIADEMKFTQPIFITITAPTEYHRLVQIKIKDKFIKLVDNPKFAGFADHVKESRDYLTDLWRCFSRSRVFRQIKEKYGSNAIYLKVFEPHLDGTPHLHILAFIPPEFEERFVSNLKSFRETKIDVKTDFNGEVGGVISYLIKYVLKTFKNSKNGELTEVAYWYIKNQIRRFTTSRTLIPLGVYRKIKSNPQFQDLFKMTHLYKEGLIEFDLIADNETYLERLRQGEKMRSSDYIKDVILVGISGFDYIEYHIAYKRSDIVRLYLKNRDTLVLCRDLRALRKENFDEQVSENISLDFLIEGVGFEPKIDFNPFALKLTFRGPRKGEKHVPICVMRDSTLYNYYKSLNTYECNIQHLAFVENELLKRGFKECLNGLSAPHDLNAPSVENFIEREKRNYDF